MGRLEVSVPLQPCLAGAAGGNIQHGVALGRAASDGAVGTLLSLLGVGGGGHCHGSWALEPPTLAIHGAAQARMCSDLPGKEVVSGGSGCASCPTQGCPAWEPEARMPSGNVGRGPGVGSLLEVGLSPVAVRTPSDAPAKP